MSEIIMGLGILFLFFQNIIMTCFPVPVILGYWDEAITLILILLWIGYVAKNSWRICMDYTLWKAFVCLTGIFIIGLSGNIFYGYAASIDAIFRDIVGFIKYPISLIVIRAIRADKKIARATIRYAVPVFKVSVIVMFLFGIVSLFKDIGMSQIGELRYGIVPYQFLFSHPTYLVLCNIMILAVLCAADNNHSMFKYELMILGNTILAMRTKGIAIACVYIFIRYSGNWLRRYKIIYWGGAAALVFAVSYSKLLQYSSFSNSPRESIYRGALQLMQLCFPFGSGFATYASHLSGKAISEVYNFITLAGVWHSGTTGAAIGDTGYPYYMGQFGIIGSILFALMMYYIYRGVSIERRNIPVLTIYLYIIIALTSESILLNNGLELGVLLAVLNSISEERGECYNAKNRNYFIV